MHAGRGRRGSNKSTHCTHIEKREQWINVSRLCLQLFLSRGESKIRREGDIQSFRIVDLYVHLEF